ncbi:hypothetical protein R6Q59_013257 [Mikania micrantha]
MTILMFSCQIKGDSTANSAFKFGSTYVVEPKGKHQATIVWLHGLGDDGSSWSQVLETLSLPNGLMSLASLKTQVKMYKEWMLQPHMFLACFPLNLQTLPLRSIFLVRLLPRRPDPAGHRRCSLQC